MSTNTDVTDVQEEFLESIDSILADNTSASLSFKPGNRSSMGGANTGSGMQVELRIALYVAIFILSVAGNALVALTIVQNRRMRTLTNVLLMNLTVSDLLLSMFCMPFTLIPTLLRDFIFGPVVCVLVRYMQGVSVGVSAFTLVAISLERYFAICRPLRSRRWQTLSHSYKMIAAVWTCALSFMLPIAVSTRVKSLGNGAHKCIELWDCKVSEKIYTAFLDIVLLVLPLVVMTTAYGLISYTLWPRGLRRVTELTISNGPRSSNDATAPVYDDTEESVTSSRPSTPAVATKFTRRCTPFQQRSRLLSNPRRPSAPADVSTTTPGSSLDSSTATHMALRLSGGAERCVTAKRRVVKMLFVVVIEFFICWTPTYVLQTWVVFDTQTATSHLSAGGMNLVHLLGFASACCHPITYGFMNASFRRGFAAVFCSSRRCRRRRPQAPPGWGDIVTL